jgi:hypothetical protein
MAAGIQRSRLDLIVEQLIKDGTLEEREANNKRGPKTKKIYVI